MPVIDRISFPFLRAVMLMIKSWNCLYLFIKTHAANSFFWTFICFRCYNRYSPFAKGVLFLTAHCGFVFTSCLMPVVCFIIFPFFWKTVFVAVRICLTAHKCKCHNHCRKRGKQVDFFHSIYSHNYLHPPRLFTSILKRQRLFWLPNNDLFSTLPKSSFSIGQTPAIYRTLFLEPEKASGKSRNRKIRLNAKRTHSFCPKDKKNASFSVYIILFLLKIPGN